MKSPARSTFWLGDCLYRPAVVNYQGARPGSDDNPDISDFVGRAELSAFWNPNPDNTLRMTLRHSLRSAARGSVRLEWLQTLGNGDSAKNRSALRFRTQLFSGCGDSLVDYNRRRTVLSVGLSLVDF